MARVIVRADEGNQLQVGEILVTTVTNVGWTPPLGLTLLTQWVD